MNAHHFPTNLFFLNQKVTNLYKKNPVLTIFSIAYSNALLIYLQILLDYKKIKTLDAIKLSYKKYISDPYHLEKKYFRPPFIKGYQKRSTSKNEMNEY